MAYASLLAEASKIASAVYRLLSHKKKKIKFYRQMTGRAMSWLKQGMAKEKIVELLKKECGVPLCASAKAVVGGGPFASLPRRSSGPTTACFFPGSPAKAKMIAGKPVRRKENNVVSQPFSSSRLLPANIPKCLLKKASLCNTGKTKYSVVKSK
jgi:hypothetical protein